jgi:hypothetical protein
MSFNRKAGSLVRQSGRGVPAVTPTAIMDRVSWALGQDNRTDKELARDLDVVPRAVRAWRARESLPSFPNMVALGRQIPELRSLVLELFDAPVQCDPAQERLTLELLRGVTRELERRQSRIKAEGAPA